MRYKNTDAAPLIDGNNIISVIFDEIERAIDEAKEQADKFEECFEMQLRNKIETAKRRFLMEGNNG